MWSARVVPRQLVLSVSPFFDLVIAIACLLNMPYNTSVRIALNTRISKQRNSPVFIITCVVARFTFFLKPATNVSPSPCLSAGHPQAPYPPTTCCVIVLLLVSDKDDWYVLLYRRYRGYRVLFGGWRWFERLEADDGIKEFAIERLS
jgi:hypothetical protein